MRFPKPCPTCRARKSTCSSSTAATARLAYALTEILEHGVFDGRVPMIAVLRGGRTNMTALDIGAHRDPVRSLESVIQAARNGEIEQRIERRDVLRISYDDEVRHGMFFGGGVIHRGIELVHATFPQGRSRGVFGSTVVVGGLLGKLIFRGGEGTVAPDKAQIHLDGGLVPTGEFTIFMSCTLPRLFARLRPFWGEGPGGVRFTALSSEARHLGRCVPGILAGRPGPLVTEDNGYLSRKREARRTPLRLRLHDRRRTGRPARRTHARHDRREQRPLRPGLTRRGRWKRPATPSRRSAPSWPPNSRPPRRPPRRPSRARS